MSKKEDVDSLSTNSKEEPSKNFILDTARTLTFVNNVSIIPVNADKIPLLGKGEVINKRNNLRTMEELNEYFDLNGNGGLRAKYLAILMDSPAMPLVALDLDRKGLKIFMNKIRPRCSEQLQKAIDETARTQTPSSSLHLLFSYSELDFPTKFTTHKYWKELGSDKDHNEITFLGTGFYLVEYGPGYNTIIGFESIQTLDKTLMDELLAGLKRFEAETDVIQALCAPDKLVKYYAPPNRDDLNMYLAGPLHRRGVPESLIMDLQECLMDAAGGDEEAPKRYDMIRRTCLKAPNKVNKDELLLGALKHDETLFREIFQQFGKLGYHSFGNQETGHASSAEKAEGKDGKEDKEYEYVQRFSNEELLAESIVIAGRPYFAIANHNTGQITVEEELIFDISEKKKRIIRPQEVKDYLSKPYSFKSKEEFDNVLELAKLNTLDSLFTTVKNVWAKYIDADDHHLSICAADTIFSYFQNEIGMTHYLFFVGDNDSGKSNNLVVFHFIGYRNLMSIGISVANIYQYLGSDEEGAGTICEDEANNIEDNADKMEIAKSGYTRGYPVIRMTITQHSRIQHRYFTYCIKLYSAEKAPDPVKAKGLVQRIIKLRCTAGDPQNDILEVANPAGDKKFQRLLDELSNVHNLLLCYRLLHAREEIPDIKLNLKNREKQLFKPVLRLFQGTKTFDHLCKVMSHYVNERRKVKTNSFHAFLAKTILEMDTDMGHDDLAVFQSEDIEMETHDIWEKIKTLTHGLTMPNRPLSYDCVEFGIISQRGMTLTLEDVFKGEYVNSDGKRKIVLNRPLLQRTSAFYTDQKIVIGLDPDTGDNDSKDSNTGSADSADSTDVGRVYPSSTERVNEENEKSEEETKEYSNNQIEETKDLDTPNPSKDCIPSLEAHYAHYPHSPDSAVGRENEEGHSYAFKEADPEPARTSELLRSHIEAEEARKNKEKET